MKLLYHWSMPNKETFKMTPIRVFIETEMLKHFEEEILIPFAGWFRFPNLHKITYIDIMPNLPQPYIRGDCINVLPDLIDKGRLFSLIILDPPYTMFQAVHMYNNKRMQDITHVRELCLKLLKPGGVVISCGYNSTGMSKKRGFKKEELLIVNCGGSHNDFLVLKEKHIVRPIL